MRPSAETGLTRKARKGVPLSYIIYKHIDLIKERKKRGRTFLVLFDLERLECLGGLHVTREVRAAAQSTLYCLSVRPSVQGSRGGGSPTDKRDNKRLAPRYREGGEGEYEHKDVLTYSSGFNRPKIVEKIPDT